MTRSGIPAPRFASLSCLVLLLCPPALPAAEPTADAFEDFAEVSLEDLLATEVAGASRGQARALRDAPAAISVVTREDIERSGARDLLDILMAVPGFQLGTDTYSAVFPGVRGVWAAEGKILVLLDGHDMSERLYSTMPLGNRIPVSWIERVEIIRGPGAAMYGGTAELAVVNIVTRQAEQIQGLAVAGEYGQLMHGLVADDQPFAGTYGRRNLSLQWGQSFPAEDIRARGAVFVGQGNRSDRLYTDSLGQSYPMAGQADTDPLLVDLAFDWRGLELRYLFERYHTSQRDGWGENQAEALPADFTTSSLQLAYTWAPHASVRLRPRLSYVWQKPWQTTDERAMAYEEVYFDPSLHEADLGLHLDWTPVREGAIVERLALLSGITYRYQWAEERFYGFVDPGDPEQTVESLDFHHLAFYLQAMLDTPWLNATAGALVEYHSRVGWTVVPCAVLQKAYGPFHFKALVTQATRAPSIMNLSNTPDVGPEKTTVYELELGLQPVAGLVFTLSGFDITVDQPITYFWDEETETEGYRNWDRTGTRGLEAEMRFQRGIWSAGLSYSFYDVVGKNRVEPYRVPGARHVLLGMAPHKATLRGGVRLFERLSLHLGLVFLSDQRWAWGPLDPEGNPTLRELPELWLLDFYLRYDDLLTPGLWVGLGGYNLLDQRVEYAQPYDNGHPPLPGQSLEILLRLGYDLPIE